MYPLFALISMLTLSALITARIVPIQLQQYAQARGEIQATNFLAYRDAVQRYINANPSFSGTITGSDLNAYRRFGDVLETDFNNQVTGGRFYVWQRPPVDPYTRNAVYRKTQHSLLVGQKQGGVLWTVAGSSIGNTGIPLPTTIPEGALVAFGG
jgi:hypothetical protein